MRRHRHKCAIGDLGPVRSVYCRGSKRRLNLADTNLVRFAQHVSEVDEVTWLYHLHRGDCPRWFREVITADALAGEAEPIMAVAELSPAENRAPAACDRGGYTLPG